VAAGFLDPFSALGLTSRAKLLILGPSGFLPEAVIDRVRSLNLEHVSPAGLMRPEISRRPSDPGQPGREAATAHLRRWFFARKPDAGFLISGFPATLLQAKIFDEWLEARDEALDAVVAAVSDHPAADHYRAHGLLFDGREDPVSA
jgi:adenylate kinase